MEQQYGATDRGREINEGNSVRTRGNTPKIETWKRGNKNWDMEG